MILPPLRKDLAKVLSCHGELVTRLFWFEETACWTGLEHWVGAASFLAALLMTPLTGMPSGHWSGTVFDLPGTFGHRSVESKEWPSSTAP